MSIEDYNIISCYTSAYRITNLSHNSSNKGWVGKLIDDKGGLMVSGSIKFILERCKELQYPLSQTNITYVLDTVKFKIDSPPWIDETIGLLNYLMVKRFRNLKIEKIYKGVDFAVVECNSVSQAKRLVKSKAWLNVYRLDRNKNRIAIMESS